MRLLKRLALWSVLLTKRLLKKPVFLILLLCVPLLSGAMALAARQDSGVVTVALVCDTREEEARRCVDRILRAQSLVRRVPYATEAEARGALERAEVDAVWLFTDGMRDDLQRFVAGRRPRGAVFVLEREDNVFLRLAREQLAAAVYPEASYALFRSHLIETMGVPEDTPREALEPYYSTQVAERPLIVFSNADGSARENTSEYLVAPVRGLLALLPLLAGLASCLYTYRDVEQGVFLRLRAGKRRLLPLLCHLCAIVPVAAAVLLALRAAGLLTGWGRETLLLLLYCLAVAAFCELLRKLCRSEARLGALTPALLAAMLSLCPIFIDLKLPEPVCSLFPPYCYLKGVHAGGYARRLALYAAVAAALAILVPERSGD